MIEISHQQAHYLIRQSLDGRRLPDEQWASLQLHLDSCAECRLYREEVGTIEKNLVRTLRNYLDLTQREPEPFRTSSFTQELMKARATARWIRKALLYAGIGGLGVLFLVMFRLFQVANAPAPTPTLVPTIPGVTATPAPIAFHFRGVFAFDAPANEPGSDPTREIYLLNPGSATGLSQLVNLTQNPADDYSPAWSPDGEWLAFLSDRIVEPEGTPKHEVFVIHVSGSRLTRLTDEPGIKWSGPLSWSTDGNWLALSGQRGSGSDSTYIFMVPTTRRLLSDGGVRALGLTRGAMGPVLFSPDTSKFVYRVNYGELQGLIMYDLSNGLSTPLTMSDVFTHRMNTGVQGVYEWSHTGERLLYLTEGPYDLSTGEIDHANPITSIRQTASLTAQAALRSIERTNEDLEIKSGIGVVRGLTAAPGQLENSAVYLQDADNTGCWNIYLRVERLGFYDTTSVPDLCVLSSLSRASWGPETGEDGSPWLFVSGKMEDEIKPAFYAVRLPDGPDPEDMKIERIADLPFLLVADQVLPPLQVRPEGRRQLSLNITAVTPHQIAETSLLPEQDTLGRLVFEIENGTTGQILTSKPDGSGLLRLTPNNTYYSCPAWSPDGGKIAYISDTNDRTTASTDIYMMDENGLFVTRLTGPGLGAPQRRFGDQATFTYNCPVWSPDGTRLAAGYNTSTADYLALIPIDGSEPEYIRINEIADRSDLAWSADGKILAFSALSNNNYPSIFTLDVDSVASGTAVITQLVVADGWEAVNGLAFIPEGLAYVVTQFSTLNEEISELRFISLDGVEFQQAVDLPAATFVRFQWRKYLFLLPDGRLSTLIPMKLDSYTKTEVVAIDYLTNRLETVAQLPEVVFDAAWSRDGDWMAYASEGGLYLLDMSPGAGMSPSPALIFDGRVNQVDLP